MVAIRYSALLTRANQFKFFGLAFIGLIIVYGSDLHYPSAMDHGPFELFLVMAGALSSLYEIARPATAKAPAFESERTPTVGLRPALPPFEAD